MKEKKTVKLKVKYLIFDQTYPSGDYKSYPVITAD